MLKKQIACFLLCLGIAQAQTLEIFGATAVKMAMQELKNAFLQEHPEANIVLHAGSSGKAYAQFMNGMKYDLFFSADSNYPKAIAEKGESLGDARPYALGKIALYVLDETLLDASLKILESARVKKVAIANPKVAPYGVGAMEILENSGVLNKVESKLVLGENLSQAIHFVDSGAAEAGLVAYALLKENSTIRGKSILIDQVLYTPLVQSYVLTKYAKENPLAVAFAAFVESEKGKTILRHYGFGVPQ